MKFGDTMKLNYNNIEKIIKDAAKIMLGADRAGMSTKEKTGAANFVTEYDFKVQNFLETEFSKLIPGCKFYSEEKEKNEPVGEGYTFVIDPIDGTMNFMLNHRASCISVGLFKDRKIVYGAVYNPYCDHFYHAVLGEGAYRNGLPISVSEREAAVGVASVGTSPYHKATLADLVIKTIYGIFMKFGDIRRIGSAALEICLVACGELDAFVEPVLSLWDYAAGMLILSEAGGIICDYDGNTPDINNSSSIIATTPKSYDALMEVIKKVKEKN